MNAMEGTVANAPQLDAGFYTLAQAVRLTGVPRRRISYWIQGDKRYGGPIIDRDFPSHGPGQTVSFLDLMEIVFIKHFSSQGLNLRYLQRVSEVMRETRSIKHPLAHSSD